MKEWKIKILVNEAEADLIYMIRNYVSSYPNGHPELLYAAQRIFDELAEPFELYE